MARRQRRVTHAKLNSELLYIKRYGDREAVRLAKLRDAVDILMDFLRRSFCNEPIRLPRGWRVRFSKIGLAWHWHLENGEYRDAHPYLCGPSDCEYDKPRELLIKFAHDIGTGWLDEVAQLLAEHRRAKITAVREIDDFVA